MFVLFVKAASVEDGFAQIVDEIRTLFSLKTMKNAVFVPEWRKSGTAEADIYFRALQSSWE